MFLNLTPKLSKVYRKDEDIDNMIYCTKLKIIRNHVLFTYLQNKLSEKMKVIPNFYNTVSRNVSLNVHQTLLSIQDIISFRLYSVMIIMYIVFLIFFNSPLMSWAVFIKFLVLCWMIQFAFLKSLLCGLQKITL